MQKLLEFRHLKTYFYTPAGIVKAVNDVSFCIKEGETLCLVGESGCGKSVTSMSLMRLISSPGKIVSGQILYKGRDLLQLRESEMKSYRGNEIAMIFQDPMSSLNPVLKIGEQISEPLIVHKRLTKKQAKTEAIRMIDLVGISRPDKIYLAYPHELSGGMRQRIMIAIALSCNPKLLIADEPTTALDVTIQAQILDLMRNIKKELNTAILFITHDLGVVAEMADYVAVMYAGKIIEEAPVNEIFLRPKHPYTQGLLKSKPIINQRQQRLYSIPGQVPNTLELEDNCYFNDRCECCFEVCLQKQPPLTESSPKHKVACWKAGI